MKSIKKIDSTGTIYYFLDSKPDHKGLGVYHREDGPAVENSAGKAYWNNGRLHRLDGPAIDHSNGKKEWFINGVEYSEDQFNKLVKQFKPEDLQQAFDILDV